MHAGVEAYSPYASLVRAGLRDDWTNVVGLRWDEPAGRGPDLCGPVTPRGMWCAPLYDAGCREGRRARMVEGAPLRSAGPRYAGNRVGCSHGRPTCATTRCARGPEVWGVVWAITGGPGPLHLGEPEGYRAGSFATREPRPCPFGRRGREGHEPTVRLHPSAVRRRPCALQAPAVPAAGGRATPRRARAWGDHPGVYYAPARGTDDAARVLFTTTNDHDHHEAP